MSIFIFLIPLHMADLGNSDCCRYRSLVKNHCHIEISQLWVWKGACFQFFQPQPTKIAYNFCVAKALVLLVQLEVQYFHPHASLTAAVGLNRVTPIDFSVTLGTPTFALGAEAGYETTSSKLTKYTAGITVTKPDSCASIIL